MAGAAVRAADILSFRCAAWASSRARSGLSLRSRSTRTSSKAASWATWDAGNNLWVARPGMVEQYTLDDLRRGASSYSLDVDQFEPPPKPIEVS
jgi:hypothetical protein